MHLDGDAAVWIGQIINFVIMIFVGGIVYAKLSTKVEKHEAALFTPENELRVITYTAHDLMSTNCNEKRDIRISHVIASHEDLKEDIANLSETVTRELKAMSESLHHLALNQAQGRGREDRPLP